MKKTLWLALILLLVCVLPLSACDFIPQLQIPNTHVHTFGEWTTSKMPTCTEVGINERYCACGEKQTQSVPTLEHQYNGGEIIRNASCIQEGLKKYTCTNPLCQYHYTESYSLPQYSATELYSQSVKYVGEIVTYNKKGEESSLATGFVISSDGKIVTNYHVIEGAYSAKISIDGKTYNIASVLAYDADIDLAVLKINANNLTAAKVCKNTVQAGETVYAIGSSRGMTNTYSQGIITYANRIVDGVSHIQHDASITHGNSGGPLINVYGEVIGINTWGISDSQNLNFAVFASELDNLVYGAPMTLAQFYKKTLNPYETLLNWVLENYNDTGDSYIEYRYQESGERYSLYSLTYFYDSDRLALQYYYLFSNNDTRYVSITLSEASSCWYFASYTDGDYSYKENITTGYIYPASFTRYTSIGYDSSEGNYWTLSSLLDTYQEGMVFSLEWFKDFLNTHRLGLSLADFGFASFS